MGTPPPNRTLARRAARAALVAAGFLLAGAVATVAVAWTCALWSPVPQGFDWNVRVYRETFPPSGHVAPLNPEWFATPPGFAYRPLPGADAKGPGLRMRVSAMLLEQIEFRRHVIDPDSQIVSVWAGWPLPALRGTVQLGDLPAVGGGAIRGRAWMKPAPAQFFFFIDQRALPYWPAWFGLAVDTALYGGMFWAVRRFPRCIECWIRRRRNLCPSCGYSREGLGAEAACPECGEPNP